MGWFRQLSASLGRMSKAATPVARESSAPESAIRRRLSHSGPIKIRELVPPGNDEGEGFRWQLLMERSEQYAEQRSILQKRLTRQNLDLFVAEHALAKPQHAPAFSYCVWRQGPPTLLPKTDFVVLYSLPSGADYWSAIVPWDELLQITGGACLIQEPDVVPSRWRAVTWPSSAMQHELRAVAVRF